MNRREFIGRLVRGGAVLAGAAAGGGLVAPLAGAAGIQPFSFVHMTDLHLDVLGENTWQYRRKSVPLFIDALRQIGRLQKLDFIIFGGDQIQNGPNDRDSLRVFQQWVHQLDVPRYMLLGNAEVSPVAGRSKLGRAEYLEAWRGRGLWPGRSSWAFDPVRDARIIGLDVTVDNRPEGLATPETLAWLAAELRRHSKKRLIIIVTHQLLLPTSPRDLTPEWSLWMVRNHEQVRRMLERHPNVRMVISGHHHVSQVEQVNGITYVSDPAIVTYPCAFRLFTVTPQGIHLRNVGLDDRSLVNQARDLLAADPYARMYDPDNPRSVIDYSSGLRPTDSETTMAW